MFDLKAAFDDLAAELHRASDEEILQNLKDHGLFATHEGDVSRVRLTGRFQPFGHDSYDGEMPCSAYKADVSCFSVIMKAKSSFLITFSTALAA